MSSNEQNHQSAQNDEFVNVIIDQINNSDQVNNAESAGRSTINAQNESPRTRNKVSENVFKLMKIEEFPNENIL